jgi:hypothetical protein
VHSTKLAWLAVIAAGALSFPKTAQADSFFSSNIINVDYGTLTVLNPDGSVNSTTNIVTADSEILPVPGVGIPASYLALIDGLVSQLESDPQSFYAGFPSFLYSGLSNLEDANGFGSVESLPDPAMAAFNQQLTEVGGPYTVVSDTGFQTQPYSQAFCEYQNTIPGFPVGPCPATGLDDPYSFTYQIGPADIGGETVTALFNFEILSRDVTEQLVATPEPAMGLPLAAGLGLLAGFRRKRRKAQVREGPPQRDSEASFAPCTSASSLAHTMVG